MLPEDFNVLEQNLIDTGYRKLTSACYGQGKYDETYDYYKPVRDSKGELLYQIFYRIWDYTDEPEYVKARLNKHMFGIELAIMPAGNERADLCYISVDFTDVDSIKRYEIVSENFYKFCKENNLLKISR